MLPLLLAKLMLSVSIDLQSYSHFLCEAGLKSAAGTSGQYSFHDQSITIKQSSICWFETWILTGSAMTRVDLQESGKTKSLDQLIWLPIVLTDGTVYVCGSFYF